MVYPVMFTMFITRTVVVVNYGVVRLSSLIINCLPGSWTCSGVVVCFNRCAIPFPSKSLLKPKWFLSIMLALLAPKVLDLDLTHCPNDHPIYSSIHTHIYIRLLTSTAAKYSISTWFPWTIYTQKSTRGCIELARQVDGVWNSFGTMYVHQLTKNIWSIPH